MPFLTERHVIVAQLDDVAVVERDGSLDGFAVNLGAQPRLAVYHNRTKLWLYGVALATYAGLVAPAGTARADDEIAQKAVTRADEFLNARARGKDILSYVHFGASYRGHAYKETRFVTRDGKKVPGHFALIYEYSWEDDGKTSVAFLCDAGGSIYEVQIVRSNAILNQPFLTANATTKVLGNLLIAAFKKQMTDEQLRKLQKTVDDADAKALLEWSLVFQQALGG